MLSEVHVAVLPKSKIVPDAFALQETLTERFSQPPCYFAFITGASRTADIERVLTIGVHGPQELHLLLLEE
jgi:L-lactate dehydrogenase complex protein LldG